jgi:hypothetical protein
MTRLKEFLGDPSPTETMLAVLRRVDDEPTIFGSSSHLVTIA